MDRQEYLSQSCRWHRHSYSCLSSIHSPRDVLGEQSESAVVAMGLLGWLHCARGQFIEARIVSQEALERGEECPGANNLILAYRDHLGLRTCCRNSAACDGSKAGCRKRTSTFATR